MLRSMYSGISGMKNFQTKLDIIGNNIANVNTYGFKKGRAVFKDMITQTVTGASAATGARGGVNPKQIGVGSQLSAIDTVHNAGAFQSTGRGLDLAISGDGFFQVADLNDNQEFTNQLYTRAGNFYMDSDGYIVNGDGKFLVGAAAKDGATGTYPSAFDIEKEDFQGNLDGDGNHLPEQELIAGGEAAYGPILIPTDAQSLNIDQNGNVTFVNAAGELKWAGQLILAKFPNPDGMDKLGANYFKDNANSGAPLLQVANESGLGTVESGYLEMSNVDLSEEFTEMIVAQRGFQANTRIITTSDEILQELMNLKR